jgi:MFS family permease
LRVGAVWLCFAFFFFTTMAFGILQSYGPALMKEIYGLNLALATSSLTAFLLGGAAGMLTGGFIAARQQHDNDKIVALALGLSVVMALLLASAWIPAWSVLPVLTIMGFFTGIAGPHRDLLVRRAATSRFGKASFGRIYGFVYSGLDAGLAISPLIFGPWMDQGRFMTVLLGVALLQAAAILTALGIGRDRQGN